MQSKSETNSRSSTRMNKEKKEPKDYEDKENIPPLVVKTLANNSKKSKFFTNLLSSPLLSPKVKKSYKPPKQLGLCLDSGVRAQPSARVERLSTDFEISDLWRDITLIPGRESNTRQTHQSTSTLNNMSVIRKITRHEHCSEEDLDVGQFNSTFVYPLHSTLKCSPTKSESALGRPAIRNLEFELDALEDAKPTSAASNHQYLPLSPLKCLEDQFHDELMTVPTSYLELIDRTKINGNLSATVVNSLQRSKRKELRSTNFLHISSSTTMRFLNNNPNKEGVDEKSAKVSRWTSRRVEENEYVLSPRACNVPIKRKVDCRSSALSSEREFRKKNKLRRGTNCQLEKTNDRSLTVVSDVSFFGGASESDSMTSNFPLARGIPHVTDRSTQTETTEGEDVGPFVNGWRFDGRLPLRRFDHEAYKMHGYMEVQRRLLSRPCLVSSSQVGGLRTSKRIKKNKIMALKSCVTNKSQLISNSKFSVLANF